jgi:hypothetical protein
VPTPRRFAEYLRFEVYIPTVYKITRKDRKTGQEITTEYSLNEVRVAEFVAACSNRFGGLTRANPDAPHAFNGFWFNPKKDKIVPDQVTWMHVLVKSEDSENAKEFFREWKIKLERAAHQQVILITYYPVHTIGDFF